MAVKFFPQARQKRAMRQAKKNVQTNQEGLRLTCEMLSEVYLNHLMLDSEEISPGMVVALAELDALAVSAHAYDPAVRNFFGYDLAFSRALSEFDQAQAAIQEAYGFDTFN